MEARDGGWERVRELGSGATGRVWLARLTAPLGGLPAGAEVAVKTLREELRADPRARATLAAEAEAARRASHPSLARVLASGEGADGPYLVQPYVPGRSLAERLALEGPLPEPLVRSVGAQVAGALAALHAAGLAHGDLKPDNVRLDADGRAVLVDLGLARELALEAGADAGTPAYLAPERARGGPPSAAADVWALAAVLYELATGRHPFLGREADRSGERALAALAAARFVPPSRRAPRLSPFLDVVLEETLARDPRRRPDAPALERALREGEAGALWREHVAARRGEAAPEAPVLRAEAHLTPLVGRDAELAALGELLEAVRVEGGGAIVRLASPPGGGKWRLVNEFASRVRLAERPPLYLYARWSDVAETRQAGALLTLVHRWLQLPPERTPGARERELLEGLLAPDEARALLDALDPGAERSVGSVPVAIASWLTALSREAPVLAFVDDLHRAGGVTLSALSALVDRLPLARVLLVLGVREETAGAGGPAVERVDELYERAAAALGGRRARRLDLGPVAPADVRRMVDRLFHRSAPRVRLAEVLWERSRGNPGLVAETLREVVARGWARPASGEGSKLVLEVEPDALPLPASLDTLIAERFRHLRPEQRRWLERLAVVGGRIEPEFLCLAFAPDARSEVDRVLADLARDGWLVPAGHRYRFARPALRETIYRALPEARREALHAAAARGLEREAAAATEPPSPEELFQRAFHLRAARAHGEVLALVVPLLRELRRRASPQRLQVLARWALEALDRLPADPALELELLEVAADAADRLGDRREERELLDRIVELDVDPETQPANAAKLYLLHGRYAAGTGQFGLARSMLRNAIHFAERSGEAVLHSEALRRLAVVQSHIGELGEARSLAQRALAAAGTVVQTALAHLALATVDALEDRVEPGLARLRRCLRELGAAEVPPLGVLGYAQLLRARLLRSAGRPARAYGAARRAVRLAQRAGERRFEVEARARLGVVLLDLDRSEEAEAELRHALLLSREIEDRRGQVIAELWLGLLLWEEDDLSALGEVERATELAREIGFYRAEAVGNALRARIDRARGQREAADRASARAVELVEVHGAELADRILVVGTRALVLDWLGRGAAGRALVRDLRRRMRRENERIEDADLRRAQRTYSTRLLEAVLSPEGPVQPRSRVEV